MRMRSSPIQESFSLLDLEWHYKIAQFRTNLTYTQQYKEKG